MDHAITLGDVLVVLAVFVGVLGALGLLVLVISLTNPFRSGH